MAKVPNRRQQIIEAARELFQTKGYENASIQDVMDVLGIAKGTVYHHFRSKEDVLEAVVETIVEESVVRMEGTLAELKGPAVRRLEGLVRAGSVAAENEEALSALHQAGNEAMHTRLLAVALKRQAPLYAELIRQGCDEGVFNTAHPLECAEFLLSGFQFLTDPGIHPWTEEDLTRRSRAFPRLIEQLLGAPEGTLAFLSTI